MRKLLLAALVVLVVAAGPVQAGAAAADVDFGPFAKGWGRHGFGLRIDPDGQARAGWRIYKWCHEDPTPPCDRLVGNEIRSGGGARLVFTRVEDTTAYGEVLETSDPETLAIGPVSFTLTMFGMAQLAQDGSEGIDLCGPDFARLAPKEVLEESPCGA